MPRMESADNVCAAFIHHLPSGDKDFLHLGRVVARTGDRLTINWQADKESQECLSDEKAARAVAKGTAVVDVQPEFVQPRPKVNIGKEQFIVLGAYG